MVNSCLKGKRGEREFSKVLLAHGFTGAYRTGQHCGKVAGDPDVIGIPGFHIECKREERFDLWGAVEQAERDALKTGDIPIVVERKNNEEWLAIFTTRVSSLIKFRIPLHYGALLKIEGVRISIYAAMAAAKVPPKYRDTGVVPTVRYTSTVRKQTVYIMWADDFLKQLDVKK